MDENEDDLPDLSPPDSVQAPAELPDDAIAPLDTTEEPPTEVPFDWDAWDPEDLDSVPEDIRPLAAAAASAIERKVQAIIDEFDDTRAMYEALLVDADPRIAELQKKIDEGTATLKEQQEATARMQAELEGERAALRAVEELAVKQETERIQAEYAAWKAANGDIFEDPVKKQNLQFLVDAPWTDDLPLQDMAALARLPSDALRQVEQFVKEGVPVPYAIKLATPPPAAQPPAPPKPPRPESADLVNRKGSSSAGASTMTKHQSIQDMPFDDAVELAFSRANRSKR